MSLAAADGRDAGNFGMGGDRGFVGRVVEVDRKHRSSDQRCQRWKLFSQSGAQRGDRRELGEFDDDRFLAGELFRRGEQFDANLESFGHVTISSSPRLVSRSAISGIKPYARARTLSG